MIELSATAIAFPQPYRPLWQRAGALALVVLLHIGMYEMLRGGLQQQAVPPATPKEIMVSLIRPTPPATPVAAPVPAPVESPPPAPPKPADTPPPKKIHKPVPKREHRPIHQAKPAPPEPSLAPVETPPTPPASRPETAAPAPATAPAVASTPAAPAIPKTVSSGVECPHLPQPDYPMLSKRMGEEGKVMLRILVSERGRIERVDIEKSSGFSRLDEAARQAVLHAVCKPYLDNGKPVPVYAIQPIRFQLDS